MMQGESEVTDKNIAQKEPCKTWAESEVVQLLWAVRWTSKGLMPVKPNVQLRKALELGPGRACACNLKQGTE